MTVLQLRIGGAVALFILIVASGAWLGISGKPYNGAVLNIHKLISIAALVAFGITVFQIRKAPGLTTAELTFAVVAGVLLLSAIISGGLSSIATMPKIVVRVHQVTLSLAVLSCGLALYQLLQPE